ncbi:hypothetical protein AcV5_001947 [Taiwanofungus camphoratus]|nr:hypothetical protein AcV5_001947 [Antrodia cinnamomea]
MAQLQDLTRCLLAAGGAVRSDGKGTYLFYTDQSALTSKLWTGTSFGDQELICTSVRPNSTASFLLGSTTRLVICISTASALSAYRYDEEEEEWVEDNAVSHYKVHPVGMLTASIDSNESVCVFFQDTSGHLIYLDNSWTSTVLPADPIAGSPISTTVVEGQMHVFYISSHDSSMHYVTKGVDGNWSDKVMARHAFEEGLRRFMVAKNEESGAFEAYILTGRNAVLHMTTEGGGEVKQLGKVDKDGKFVAGTSAECCPYVWAPVVCYPRPMVCYPMVRYYCF